MRSSVKFALGVGFLLLAALWQQQVVFAMAAVVAVGDDAVLPCDLAPPLSMGRVLAVEWARVDVSPTVTLMVFRGGSALEKERGQVYDGRTSMGSDGRSLRIANVGRHDNGTYRCYVRFEGMQDGEALVQLMIVVVSRPLITLTKTQSRELLLGCEARDWFPKPEVSWQDGEGGMLPSDPPETQRNRSHDFYNVRTNLNITAVKRMSNVLLCRATVQNISLTQQIQLGGNWENTASDWTDSQLIYSSYLHIFICSLCVAIGCMLQLLFSRHGVIFNKVDIWLQLCLKGNPVLQNKYSAYGNIGEVDTTGASEANARENGLRVGGVEASQEFAKRDHTEMLKYRRIILKVAEKHAIHPGLIAAIISRQSRAGRDLKPDGYGKYDSECHGLMQLNEAYQPLARDPYSEDHIDKGTMILTQAIKAIWRAKKNIWKENQILKGGIAAYIRDANQVGDQYEEVDASTPYGDFSNDVVARAQWYAVHGFT